MRKAQKLMCRILCLPMSCVFCIYFSLMRCSISLTAGSFECDIGPCLLLRPTLMLVSHSPSFVRIPSQPYNRSAAYWSFSISDIAPHNIQAFLAVDHGQCITFDLDRLCLSSYNIPNVWAQHEDKNGVFRTRTVGAEYAFLLGHVGSSFIVILMKGD